MNRHHFDEDMQQFTDFEYEENAELLNHRRKIRRMLEDKLDKRRLKAEIKDDFCEDDFEDEFDWGDRGR